MVYDRLRRLTGVALLLTGLAVALGAILGDPTIESHDDREKFVEQVGNAADRIPIIYAFQVAEVVSGFLTLAAGMALYLLLRERTRVTASWPFCSSRSRASWRRGEPLSGRDGSCCR